MKSGNYQEIVRQLAQEWAKVELPGVCFSSSDHIRIIGQLLISTQSQERSESILISILKQAAELGKTCHWVEQEIRFEELAQATDRLALIRLQLTYSDPIDDAALDAYNERIKRFNLSSHSTSTQD